MLSDKLRLSLHSFDKVVMPAVEAGCGRKDVAAVRVVRANLADLLDNLVSWERAAGPDAIARLTVADQLPDNVLRLAQVLARKGVRVGMAFVARDVPPGEKWTFDHPSMAEVMAREGKTKMLSDDGGPAPSDGGDAA